MGATEIAYVVFGLLAILLVIGVPIGFSMGLAGILGLMLSRNLDIALTGAGISAYTAVAMYALIVVPLFILMGCFCFASGIARDAYDIAYKWVGRVPGGLVITTIVACGLFGAISGSSTATAAAIGKVALPELDAHKVDKKLAVGALASGGTLGVMIPPSVILVIYAVIAQQPVGKCLMAGFLPGVLSIIMFSIMIFTRVKLDPKLAPIPAERYGPIEKIRSLGQIWKILILFLIVMGGIYSGIVTVTEAAALGAVAAFVLMVIFGKDTWGSLKASALETAEITGMIFPLLIGTFTFSMYFVLSGIPTAISRAITEAGFSGMTILIFLLVLYIPMGMMMDTISMELLTLPIFIPVLLELGLNGVWIGIVTTKLCEIALVTPPVGVNVYVVKGIAPGVPLEDIFRGITWFVITDIVTVTILLAFPIISLFLPNIMFG